MNTELQVSTGSTAGAVSPMTDYATMTREEEARRREMLGWVGEYLTRLKARGRSPEHISANIRAIRVALEVEGFTIDEASVMNVLGSLRELTRAACTRNKYLRYLKSFTAWLARRRYVAFDALSDVYLEPAQSDPRHTRTAMTEAQLAALITVTEASPWHWGMARIPGKDRAETYHAAACTGVRAGTLAQLLVNQFDLDGPTPCLKTRANQEKGKRGRTIPIHPTSAERLRSYFAGKAPDSLAFPMPTKAQLVRMLRRDLQAAGIRYCVEVIDPETKKVQQRVEVIDFHSIRHTYGTRLFRAKVHPRLAQELMGHTDINLTMKIYSHLAVEESAAAVATLPPLPGPSRPTVPGAHEK